LFEQLVRKALVIGKGRGRGGEVGAAVVEMFAELVVFGRFLGF